VDGGRHGGGDIGGDTARIVAIMRSSAATRPSSSALLALSAAFWLNRDASDALPSVMSQLVLKLWAPWSIAM